MELPRLRSDEVSGPGWRARRTAFKAERWRCNGHQTGQRLDITENGARKIYFSMRCVRDATERRGGKGYPYCDDRHEFSLVATDPKMPFVHGDEMQTQSGRYVCACDLCATPAPPAPATGGGGNGLGPLAAGGLGQPGAVGGVRWLPRACALAAMARSLDEVERLLLNRVVQQLEPLPDLFKKEDDRGK